MAIGTSQLRLVSAGDRLVIGGRAANWGQLVVHCFNPSVPYTTELRDESARRPLIWIGDAVKRARHARGLSQHALARQCGVDQGTISRLERGLAPGMRIESLARILRVVFAIDMRTDGPIPPVATRFD